jgi:hypothetical protein
MDGDWLKMLLAAMTNKIKWIDGPLRAAVGWKLLGRCGTVVVSDGMFARILLLLITANGLIDLITVHRHFLGRFDAQADFVAANFYDDNRNVIIDNDALVLFP